MSIPPEPGQIVQVRNLRFVVADVNRGSLPTGSLAEGLNHAQHLVSLTSIEDDALGEELRVVWELEPGARIFDDANLKDYQLDPLVRAIQMQRVNLLIADDVGFGKTVEAGLVQL